MWYIYYTVSSSIGVAPHIVSYIPLYHIYHMTISVSYMIHCAIYTQCIMYQCIIYSTVSYLHRVSYLPHCVMQSHCAIPHCIISTSCIISASVSYLHHCGMTLHCVMLHCIISASCVIFASVVDLPQCAPPRLCAIAHCVQSATVADRQQEITVIFRGSLKNLPDTAEDGFRFYDETEKPFYFTKINPGPRPNPRVPPSQLHNPNTLNHTLLSYTPT
jgi:hypothetical protein